MGGLGAKGTILRAATGLGVDDSAEFYSMAIVMVSNPAGAMEKEGDKIVFYPKEVQGRGCNRPPIIQGLLNALFDKRLHGRDS
jgi:hypothetical protein